MNDIEQEAIEYVADRFRRLGVVVQEEGVQTVLDYYQEYFEEVYEPSGDIGVAVFTHEDLVSYIADTSDIPIDTIHAVLDKRQLFIDSLYVGDE